MLTININSPRYSKENNHSTDGTVLLSQCSDVHITYRYKLIKYRKLANSANFSTHTRVGFDFDKVNANNNTSIVL